MRKAMQFLMWFFYNLYWAMKIYNEMSVKDFVSQLNVWEYKRSQTDLDKVRYILTHSYKDASTNAKTFFGKYYFYRATKDIICYAAIETLICMTFVWAGSTYINDLIYSKDLICIAVCELVVIAIFVKIILIQVKRIRKLCNEAKMLVL